MAIALMQLGIKGFIPQPQTAFTLPLLGVGIAFLELFQKLCDIGLKILCHNNDVFSGSLDNPEFTSHRILNDTSAP